MARGWDELFIVDGDRTGIASDPPEASDPAAGLDGRSGFFTRLRDNLTKTRRALRAEVQATLFEQLDAETWERLEEALIAADVGARMTAQVVASLEQEATAGSLEGGEALRERLIELLAELATPAGAEGQSDRIDLRARPTVILAVGVNGTGKTTTIGKLAWHLREQLNQTVVLGAADTFRAAAVEQLEQWGERAGCEVVSGAPSSDPGSVAFDTIEVASSRGADTAIIDTAGRLHNRDELMAELAKVVRVIAKRLPGAPHETLLTVDATTGQNGLRQAKLFAETVDVSGIVLTKLDGTARGGIALAIAGELGLAVKLIGVGEALEDLRPFDPGDFARALLS
ncbi:MAG TPA: signal recognition particle-docking protein FtsY [Solirubrobacteraceae bacterium]|nr:signal recognition particle-docking protein FtsY [Solirubrobacteraceae bacterium]